MGKAKPAKHTAAELKAKAQAALTNKGGGKAGLEDRKGGKAGHAKFLCPICKSQAPDLKSMQMHYESKHPGTPFNESDFVDLHETHGGTTQGVGIRGSLKKK